MNVLIVDPIPALDELIMFFVMYPYCYIARKVGAYTWLSAIFGRRLQ